MITTFDKFRKKIDTMSINDVLVNRAIDSTIEKNLYLKGVLENIKNITDDKQMRNELFRAFVETQGTFIGSEEQRVKVMLFLNKIILGDLKKTKKYKKAVRETSVEDIADTLSKNEQLQTFIQDLIPKEQGHALNLALAQSIKNQRDSSLKTFVNKTMLASEVRYFTEVQKINMSYEELISWALTNKKPQPTRATKKKTDLTSILMTIIQNTFRNSNVEITQNDFIMKAGKLFLKLYYISTPTKESAKDWFNKYSEKDIASIGEFLLGLFGKGEFFITIEKRKKKDKVFVKQKFLKLDPTFVQEVFDKLFNIQAYPQLYPAPNWGLSEKNEIILEKTGERTEDLITQRDYTAGDEEKGSFLEVTPDALNIINNTQKIAFEIDKKLLNYMIENLDLLFKQQKLDDVLRFKDYKEYINNFMTVKEFGELANFQYNLYSDQYSKKITKVERILDTIGKAMLLENEEFYFTALLDFRGRCYFHSYGLGIQEYVFGRSLIKMKASISEEIHLDVKSSVLQILLGYLNDPFNKLHLTNLYEGEASMDIYEAGLTFIKAELDKISPEISKIISIQTGKPYIERNLFKGILMKNLYSQSYQGLVTEFKRDYYEFIKKMKEILEKNKLTTVGTLTTETGNEYKKTYIKQVEDFALILNPKAKGFDASHLIPGLATKYINDNFPELLAYKKLFQLLAKINGDKPMHLTKDQLLTPMQYYTLKEETSIPTKFSKYNKRAIQILTEVEPTQIDLKKTIRSTGVNFTHATDALIMFKTLEKMQSKGIPVAPIHDSFRVEKRFALELNQAYKKSFEEIIFKQDLLKDIYFRVLEGNSKALDKDIAELNKTWTAIEDFRTLGAKHKKIYRKEILTLETKKHVSVGFLENSSID